MSFKWEGNGGNSWGTNWVLAKGEIVQETPDLLEKILKTAGHNAIIKFDSGGGNLFAGLEMGRLLHKYNAYVETDTICASACAYAFLGGADRIAGPGELGFHQFYSHKTLLNMEIPSFSGRDLLVEQVIAGALINYLVEVGASTEIYTIAANIPPDQLLFLDNDQLERLGINTKPTTSSPWSLQPFKKGLIAEISQTDTFNGYRRARLYCTSNIFYFTIYRKIDENTPNLIHILEKAKKNLNFSGIKPNGSINKFEHFKIENNETLALVFEIDKSLAKELARTENIGFDYFSTDMPRAAIWAFNALSFGKIGNLGLPNFAFKHCI